MTIANVVPFCATCVESVFVQSAHCNVLVVSVGIVQTVLRDVLVTFSWPVRCVTQNARSVQIIFAETVQKVALTAMISHATTVLVRAVLFVIKAYATTVCYDVPIVTKAYATVVCWDVATAGKTYAMAVCCDVLNVRKTPAQIVSRTVAVP